MYPFGAWFGGRSQVNVIYATFVHDISEFVAGGSAIAASAHTSGIDLA
jgi:hypothetical protein